ncbi:hypothetical protein FKP32DRAFT_1674826 [Trametes sanguinea]|nr:hypothetical protein FKP32DRAFT_1674826 [Trametes sanguinea]
MPGFGPPLPGVHWGPVMHGDPHALGEGPGVMHHGAQISPGALGLGFQAHRHYAGGPGYTPEATGSTITQQCDSSQAQTPAVEHANNLNLLSVPGGRAQPSQPLGMILSPEVIAQIKHIAREEARLLISEELKDIRTRLDANPQVMRSVTSKQRVPPALADAVHKDMRRLMGVVPTKVAAGKKCLYKLPHALAPGKEPLTSTDPDATRLWNPRWDLPVDEGVNRQFIEATVELISTNGVSVHQLAEEFASDTHLIRQAAQTYLRSLKREYAAQNNDEKNQRQAKKRKGDKHNARRDNKADDRRQGIKLFRTVFGKKNTAGVTRLVRAQWQSSEHSDDGAAGADDLADERRKWSVSEQALEVRHLAWRSRKLMRLYLLLTVFERFAHETAPAMLGDAKDLEDDDLDFLDDMDDSASPEERERLLARVLSVVKGWRTVYVRSGKRRDRFRGPEANYDQDMRVDKGGDAPIYKECISKRWAASSEDNRRLYRSAPSLPSECTVLDVEYPPELVPAGDQSLWFRELWDMEEDEGFDGGDEESENTDGMGGGL